MARPHHKMKKGLWVSGSTLPGSSPQEREGIQRVTQETLHVTRWALPWSQLICKVRTPAVPPPEMPNGLAKTAWVLISCYRVHLGHRTATIHSEQLCLGSSPSSEPILTVHHWLSTKLSLGRGVLVWKMRCR